MNTKRMTIRLAPEDEQWLAAEAADEGLDPAAMVRVILARLRQGRPAIYREALLAQVQAATAAQRVLARHPLNAMMPPPLRVDVSGEVVEPAHPEYDASEDADAAQVLTNAIDEVIREDEPQPAAIPLRLVGREKYNPGVR